MLAVEHVPVLLGEPAERGVALRALHGEAMRRSYAPGGAGYERARKDFDASAALAAAARRGAGRGAAAPAAACA